ncbi:MAG: hypothetical protein R2857_15375 [Vampirovibrionales bacterium]
MPDLSGLRVNYRRQRSGRDRGDAASNNGVEDMRELLERVSLAAMEGRYKIYIIDEVPCSVPRRLMPCLKPLRNRPRMWCFYFCRHHRAAQGVADHYQPLPAV